MTGDKEKPTKVGDETDLGLVFPGEEAPATSAGLEAIEENGLETDDHQAAEIREIFGTAFPQYLQPVEEILDQLLSGTGDADSIDVLDGMVASLMEASSRMGFDDVHKILGKLRLTISSIDPDAKVPPSLKLKQEIRGAVTNLKKIAQEMGGQAPVVEEKKPERKTIIAALRNKDGIGKVALKRLSAAGLVTVDQLLMATPEEIAAVTGLNLDIVHTILSHVSENPPKAKPPKASAKEVGSEAVDTEVESHHERIIENLHKEAEMEVTLESLRAEVRGSRSRVFEYRAEIKSVDISLEERKKAVDAFQTQMSARKGIVEELRAKRDALMRKYAESEEVNERNYLKLQSIRQQRRNVEAEAVNLSREVGSLLDTIQRVYRTIAKRQIV